MKLILFFLCLTGCAALAMAQTAETCNLAIKDAPALLNLKLEMSPAEVQSIFGSDLKIKITKDGERIFFQNFIKNPAPNSLRGVRALYLRFFDRKLYQIEVFYTEKPELTTAINVTDYLFGTTAFSAPFWKDIKGKRVLSCPEFTITADDVLNPHVELTATNVLPQVIEYRRLKAKK